MNLTPYFLHGTDLPGSGETGAYGSIDGAAKWRPLFACLFASRAVRLLGLRCGLHVQGIDIDLVPGCLGRLHRACRKVEVHRRHPGFENIPAIKERNIFGIIVARSHCCLAKEYPVIDAAGPCLDRIQVRRPFTVEVPVQATRQRKLGRLVERQRLELGE